MYNCTVQYEYIWVERFLKFQNGNSSFCANSKIALFDVAFFARRTTS